jgi:hypothetical protein
MLGPTQIARIGGQLAHFPLRGGRQRLGWLLLLLLLLLYLIDAGWRHSDYGSQGRELIGRSHSSIAGLEESVRALLLE